MIAKAEKDFCLKRSQKKGPCRVPFFMPKILSSLRSGEALSLGISQSLEVNSKVSKFLGGFNEIHDCDCCTFYRLVCICF